MGELKPQDIKLIEWAETRSSTVFIQQWPNTKNNKEALILIPSRSLAEVAPYNQPLLEHVRVALLEQHFLESMEAPDA